ncbi:FecR domain-containing protein [Mucilaginibacter sp.]|jgi:ferric-dicitrate binding protein FerR (iron transport regulator)|uniref:FecR domain-containing protein n=1 Tax=Mucilaginibacter sp. TaxID=1882438 RepID=UPI0035628711
MTNTRLLYLYQRYIDDQCTAAELRELKSLLKDPALEADLQQMLDHTWDELSNDPSLVDVSEQRSLQIYQQIVEQAQYQKKNQYWWLKIAASILLLVSVSLLWYTSQKQPALTAQLEKPKTPDIMPGDNNAVLTLANGSKVILNSAQNGQIARQEGTTIQKVKDGQLVYATAVNTNAQEGLQWNTITIPKGGQYGLVLADGTRVYLNSASSLTYPTAFSGTSREVSLKGEAYFEVAKNAKMPFKVNVNDRQQVEVLGTHFNIEAYSDDRVIHTTLLEGSVKLLYRDKQTILKPGQMAVNDIGASSLLIKPADSDEVMAWRNGMFIFNNENITSLMKRISRWYDIDVVFKGNMKDISFVGNYSRNKSLANLLRNIESTERVHFLIEGRRVTVIAQ